MIINKTSVSFAGRVPSPRYIPVGVVGDNRVECVEFKLPKIADSQTATMLINCKFADAITLEHIENNLYCADITSQIAGESGNIEAYIRINGTDGAVWNSEKIILCVCNVPDISGKVEEQQPTALERTLSAIAAHNADMEQHSETMEQISKTASESAVAAERYATAAEKSAQAAAKHEAVSYKPQELTESQQAQARQNIAAASKAEVDKLYEEKADKSEIPEPYTLPVASADALGGVKIGKGLAMNGEMLSVEPEKEYELIELIFAGYTLLTEQPDDWGTNYSAYYEVESGYDGLAGRSYEILSALESAKPWQPYMYYVATEEMVNAVKRSAEPNGTPYAFKKLYAEIVTPTVAEAQAGVLVYKNKNVVYITSMAATSEPGKMTKCHLISDNGMLRAYGLNVTDNDYSQAAQSSLYHYAYGGLMISAIDAFEVKFTKTTWSFPVGSKIKIMGVRA